MATSPPHVLLTHPRVPLTHPCGHLSRASPQHTTEKLDIYGKLCHSLGNELYMIVPLGLIQTTKQEHLHINWMCKFLLHFDH